MTYENQIRWNKAHPEQLRGIKGRWRATNKDRIKSQSAEYREANRGGINFRNRLRYYQNRDKEAERKKKANELKRQIRNAGKPEMCEICGIKTELVWDHCHVFNEFRGWICNNCNLGLGLVHDNPEVLRAMAEYLERR
jgi:Recombination endonuclease VII